MKIRYLATFVIFLLIQTYAVAALSEESEADKIEQALEKYSWVNIIVWLKDNEFTSPAFQADDVKKRQEIDRIQDAVLSQLTSDDFKIQFRYEVTNGFAGLVSRSGLEKLRLDPNVNEIFLDREVHALLTESRPLIRADAVESLGITGQNITVCVLDTGIDYNHPALATRYVGGYDFCNGRPQFPQPSRMPCTGQPDSDPMDENGHGTHVAGIVASTDSRIRGIAPGVKIASVKVLNNTGHGTFGAAAAGIDWCIGNRTNYNIKVITMSFGQDPLPSNCLTLIDAEIQNARNAGIFVDAASGNGGLIDRIYYPACAPSVVSVGATYDYVGDYRGSCTERTQIDNITCFTNRNSNLDLLAPGAIISSTNISGNFKESAGTSMAAPHVAGVAALLFQANPSLTPSQIENVLKATGVPVYDAGTGLTFPRIDALAAINAVTNFALAMQGFPSVNSTLQLNVYDPSGANKVYLLLMSLGTTFGTPLGDGRTFPLDLDPLLLLSITNPISIGLQNNIGALTPQGRATATWAIPNVRELSGLSVYAAFMTIDTQRPFPQGVTFISNVLPILIRPSFTRFPIDANTVALWHFDEGSGTVLSDASGNNNHGTVYNASWVQSPSGTALRFNGQNSYVYIPSGSSLAQQRITIEAWIKFNGLTNLQNEQHILAKDAQYVSAIFDRRSPQQQLYYGFGNQGGICAGGWCSGGWTATIGEWHHVAMQYDGTTMKSFVDGRLTSQYSRIFYISTTNNPLGIGARPYLSSQPSGYFKGEIDEIRISNIARY